MAARLQAISGVHAVLLLTGKQGTQYASTGNCREGSAKCIQNLEC